MKGSGTPLQSGGFPGANVLLVTIDTLRQDRLGAYGNRSRLTPTLDSLAEHGIRYAHAYSHVPLTLPAHTSILTGLTPARHGVRNNGTFRAPDQIPTLATVLKSAGYRTGAFIGAFVLDARFGLNRGFDEYDDRIPHARRSAFRFGERRAGEVVQLAGDWILTGPARARSGAPWFAWIHLFDPHAPYDAPSEYRAGRSPYDAEVRYTDAMLGQLFDRLRAGHALDHTVVVVTADHGESLGEHGETTHGLFAYNATIEVPLFIAAPGIRPAVIDAAAGHVDIMPTILDVVGLQAPSGLEGQSLAGPIPGDRPLYFESLDSALTRGWAPLTGVVRGPWKYIDLPEPELYDLHADPHELVNRINDDSHWVLLRNALRDLRSALPEFAAAANLDNEAAARLRSLGYTGAAGGTLDRRGRAEIRAADDPKRLVSLNERFNSALEAFNEGHSSEALSAFLSILHERPDFVTARTSAATLLMDANRAHDAVALLRSAPADELSSPDLQAKLGAALRDAGDLRASAAAFERARAAGNQSPDVASDLAVVYARLGRPAEARALFDELLRRDPNAANTWYNFGLVELQARHAEAAADAFRHATAAEPSYGEAWQGLGAALLKTDRAAALDAWRRAERLLPDDYDLLFNLAVSLADTGQPNDALPYLRRFAREAPPARYARDIEHVNHIIARIARTNPS